MAALYGDDDDDLGDIMDLGGDNDEVHAAAVSVVSR